MASRARSRPPSARRSSAAMRSLKVCLVGPMSQGSPRPARSLRPPSSTNVSTITSGSMWFALRNATTLRPVRRSMPSEQLVAHRVLELRAKAGDDALAARSGERALPRRHALAQHDGDDVLVDDRARAARTAPGVAGDDRGDEFGDRGVELAADWTLSEIRHVSPPKTRCQCVLGAGFYRLRFAFKPTLRPLPRHPPARARSSRGCAPRAWRRRAPDRPRRRAHPHRGRATGTWPSRR